MAKPMVLTKENVIATMEGRKNMTRRIINNSFLQSIPFDELETAMNTPPHLHGDEWYYELQSEVDDTEHFKIKPRYQVGDEVYVSEGYQIIEDYDTTDGIVVQGIYLADKIEFEITLTDIEAGKFLARKYPYRPTAGRFMYASLARTFRTITEVGVEKVQDISEEDAQAEGCLNDVVLIYEGMGGPVDYKGLYAVERFEDLWNSIHGPGAWGLNPYVFVYKWIRSK